MIGLGLLMAHGLIPDNVGWQGLDALGWGRDDGARIRSLAAKVFIILMTVNLVIIWAWLIRCAAKGDFLRLGGGLLAGAFLIATYLYLRPTQHPDGRGKARWECRHELSGSDFIPVSTSSADGVTFQTDIAPILETSCLSCHGPRKRIAGFRADQYNDFFRDDGKGPLVLPGNSGASRLVAIVSGAVKIRRNAGAHVLPADDVVLIKAWIDQGAR